MSRRGGRWSFALLLLASVLSASCEEDKPGGGLLLLVSRDGPLPVDRVDLTITSGDEVLHETQYRVPEEASLPTTFGITSNGDSTASVKITVTGWGDGKPLDRRDAIVTQVPSSRIALLKVVLSGTCSPKVLLVDDQAVSACGEDNTCDPETGDCTSAEIDARELPTYDPEDPELGEGGAPGIGGGGGEAGVATAGTFNTSGAGAGGLAGDAGMAGQAGVGGQSPACAAGFDDCDDDPSDCETSIATDIGNCGECGETCPTAQGHGYCDAGTCAVTTCTAPLADCNLEASDGCEIDTTLSNSNCLGCNQACQDPTPFCTPTGCAAHRDIQMMSDDAAVFFWEEAPEGEAYRRSFSHSHTLTMPYREGDQGRALVVGAVGYFANLAPQSLEYAGIPMQAGPPATNGGSQMLLYYLMDGSLPQAAGDYPLELTVNSIPAGSVALQVLELRNVRQIGMLSGSAVAPGDCSPMDISYSFIASGSFTYALAAAYGTDGLGPSLYPEPPFEYASIDLGLSFDLNLGNALFTTDIGGQLSWTSEVCAGGTGVAATASFARMSNDEIAVP